MNGAIVAGTENAVSKLQRLFFARFADGQSVAPDGAQRNPGNRAVMTLR